MTSLVPKINGRIKAEEEKIEALQRIIVSHKSKIRYYRDMLKIAGELEGNEQ